jgi:predicted DCC family thiol-disulfide oxidoreductase YuxK
MLPCVARRNGQFLMKSSVHLAAPPSKPLMVFDGDCNFCSLWIRRWQQITGDAVDYLPSQDPQISTRFPEIPADQYSKSVQLIETDGSVFSGSEAVFRVLASNPNWHWPAHIYESYDGFAAASEAIYGFIAGHRTAFSFVTRWAWGKHAELPDYFLTRWLFLRGLGVIYLIAFISLWMQVPGLIGHNGIMSAHFLISDARQYFDSHGIGFDRYRQLPTLCWFGTSDNFLLFQCAAGSVLAVILILGIAPMPCLVLLWLLYLSLTVASGDFFGFQWDNLLLETGFLTIFFAPLQLLPGLAREAPPSRLVLWLLRLLLFKLIFSSGCVKLLSGDPNWRNLTALTYHYQTQPLPTWAAWYANQLPLWFQKLSCFSMFCIELGAPFLIFLPRRLRFSGGVAIVFLQILILLTGNYTFFNWLTLLLCVLLLDDFIFRKFWPKHSAKVTVNTGQSTGARRLQWRPVVIIPVAVVFISIYVLQIGMKTGLSPNTLRPVALADTLLSPFRTINDYGLFAVMTTERNEIVVEGSNDGTNWLDYGFKYKPGEVTRRPGFIAPYQPRLDWQMWFAALGNYQQNPWFQNFCVRLLQGSPEVLALMEKNPFPHKPPKFIRAEVYDYQFTTFDERRATGAWWRRELIGEYLPPVSLNE